MVIHNPPTRDALLQMDEGEVYNDIHEKFSFHRLPSPNYKWVQHGHLLAGYDAWYYSYVWYVLFLHVVLSILSLTAVTSYQCTRLCCRFVSDDICPEPLFSRSLGEVPPRDP